MNSGDFLASHPYEFRQSEVRALPAWDEYEVKRRSSAAVGNELPATSGLPTSDPDELLDAAEGVTEQSVAVDLLQ